MRKPLIFYGWIVVALGFLTVGFAGGILYTFSVFFVALLQEFGGSRADTALGVSLFVLVQGIANPMVGMLVERYGVRALMPVGSLLLGAALAACSLVNTLWQYYLVFGVLVAMGTCTIGLVPSYAAINPWFVKRRGLALGVASAGIGAIGMVIMVPLAQFLVSTVGWRNGYLWLAVITVVVLPAATRLLHRNRPQDLGILPDGAKSPPLQTGGTQPLQGSATVKGGRSRTAIARAALLDHRFWMLCMVFFLTPFATQTALVHQVAYFVDLGYSPLVAAGVAAFVGLVSVPFKMGSGWLSDRLGRRVVYAAGVSCAVLGLLTLLAMQYTRGEWSLYLYAALFAVGYATQATINPAVAGDLFPGDQFPVVYGLLSCPSHFGVAFGAWLAGYIFDLGGSYAPAFLTSIVAIVLAAAVIWFNAPRAGPAAIRLKA